MAQRDNSDVARVIGNTEHDIVIGRLIERTDQITRLGERLSNNHEDFTKVIASIDITLTKMQVVLDGIVEDRKEEKVQLAATLAELDDRLSVCEIWTSDVKFIQDLRAGWTKVLIWSIIGAGLLLVAVARFGSATKFLE